MKSPCLIVLGAMLGIVSQAAFAFQEINGTSQDGTKAGAAPSVNLNSPVPPARTPGQEIRVPGLGTIGVLPKLDFGLELLYGASGQSAAPSGPADEKQDSGAQIRGTLKYRFPN